MAQVNRLCPTVPVTSHQLSSYPRRITSMPQILSILKIYNSHRLLMLTSFLTLSAPLKAPLSPHLPLPYTSATEALMSSHSIISLTNQAPQTPYHPHIPPNTHFKHVLTHTFHGPHIPENSRMECWHQQIFLPLVQFSGALQWHHPRRTRPLSMWIPHTTGNSVCTWDT